MKILPQNDYKADKPLVAFGKRTKNVDINFPDYSILNICEQFGNELKAVKKFLSKAL